MNRILVIRGGAIGDFVLTLPAIKLLRDRFPKAHLEILGSKSIALLAEKRFYADAIRSLESASFARFFAKGAELPTDLLDYFGSFELIVSYLYDPDQIFEINVKSAGAVEFIAGPSKLDNSEHAAFQLARPLEALGLTLADPAARLFPAGPDRDAIQALLDRTGKTIALHPGSGSETKNWPIENWIKLGVALLAEGHSVTIIAGEADTGRTRSLKAAWNGKPVQFAENLPLPRLAALLEHSFFVGHDSGISHIAAAAGARCILLFGWTDPAIWAPGNDEVTVVRAPNGSMALLEVDAVLARIRQVREARTATS